MQRYKKNLHVEGNKVISYTTHVATIDGDKLYRHGYWSVTTSKHINYVAREYVLTIEDRAREESTSVPKSALGKQMKAVAGACAAGQVLCNTQEEKNAWNKKMLNTIHGISFPDDFDSLPEAEKTKRLEGALSMI